MSDDGEYGPGETPVPASYRLADSMGVFAEDIQLKKASFFGDDDDFEPGLFIHDECMIEQRLCLVSQCEYFRTRLCLVSQCEYFRTRLCLVSQCEYFRTRLCLVSQCEYFRTRLCLVSQ